MKTRCNFVCAALAVIVFQFAGIHPQPVCAAEVVAWGYNNYGQTNVPSGLSNIVAVAAGDYHSLALRADGTVAAWGSYYNGLAGYIPMTTLWGLSNVVAVAAGNSLSLALRADGTVVAWGYSDNGQTNVPTGLGNVVAVSVGLGHSLALRADGTVAAWGSYYARSAHDKDVPVTVPAGLSNVVAVAAGGGYSLALQADGTVAAWGYNYSGQTNVPFGLSNVVAVAAGGAHSLALAGYGPPFTMLRLVNQSITAGGTARFIMAASGAVPLSYQWRLNGTNLDSATNALLVLTNVQANQAGAYSVVASNSFGTAFSSEGILTVLSSHTRFITSSGGLFVSGGQLYLSVEGSTGTQFILEKSEDLENWMPAQTNILSAGVMQLNEPTGTNNHQFFRMNAPNAVPNP